MNEFDKLFFYNSPWPVWIKDLQGKYVMVNKLYADLIGTTIENIKGKTWYSFLPLAKANRYSVYFEEVKKDRQEKHFIDQDDKHLLENYLFPIFDDSKELVGIGGMVLNTGEFTKMKTYLTQISKKDFLTGVNSRHSFHEYAVTLNNEKDVPLSVVMCDINGLRLINHAFGQEEGDRVLKVLANILKEVCTSHDKIFRWGGDEFIIIMPNVSEQLCEEKMNQIESLYKAHDHEWIELSLSFGCITTDILEPDIYECIRKAEKHLYRQKLIQEKSTGGSIMYSLQNSLEAKNLETQQHTQRMLNYSLKIGRRMSLKIAELDELTLVTKLHDIGKIGIREDILLKPGKLTKEEFEVMKTHTEKGLRIVQASNELYEVGINILTHHERWDGTGYPIGLKGDEIPLISRIVSIVDAYDAMTNDRVYKKAITKEEAIEEMKRCAGTQFDPRLVELFLEILQNEIE